MVATPMATMVLEATMEAEGTMTTTGTTTETATVTMTTTQMATERRELVKSSGTTFLIAAQEKTLKPERKL